MKKFLLVFLLLPLAYTLLAQSPAPKITLEDLWVNYAYYPQTVHGYQPMNDGKTYSILNQGDIEIYSYKSGKKVKTLVESKAFIPEGAKKALRFRSYSFSDDEKKLLIVTNKKSIYRHSFSADYWVYDLEKKELKPLSKNGSQQLATFSPSGEKVAFVRDNNIFVVDLKNGEELQITQDGEKNMIINGAPDWVYEEEFSFSRAFEWDPSGLKIAYIRFDEGKVKQYELTYWGDLYPEKYKYKYPKAGEDNSLVEVHVFDLQRGKDVKMDIGSETDIYIPRIKWTKAMNKLSIQRLNRLQNHFEILIADAMSGSSTVVFEEKSKYYVDIADNLIWLEDQDGFLLNSERSGYNHLYHFDINGNVVKQLTKGKYDVIEVNGYDETNHLLYYVAAESSPMNRDLYRVNIKKGKKEKISTRVGTNSPQYSKGFKYFVNTYTALNTPPIVTVNTADGDEISVLEDNASMVKRMEENDFSKAEFFTFKTDEKLELNGWMIKPKNFDEKRRYPVLMYVYGGPGSQTVLNDWGWFNYVWFQMLAQQGYIVVSVDGRGTGARGEEFKKCTYLQLGKLETEDQIQGAQYLGSLPYVDNKRIGMFGWSFGGYMTSLCMTKGANYFNTGIAVAPVTNWRYYDNIYTERFMRTPQENGDNYDSNSPINHVEKMKGNFLLIHGSADDNVHIQNSWDLITALLEKNKYFEMQFYPNSDHGIASGRYVRYQLYKRMTEYLLRNL